MTKRLHQLLDGELPRTAASETELNEVAQTEAAIGAVLRALPTQPLPDLAAKVLQRIQGITPVPPPAPRFDYARRMARWFWSGRPVTLSWRPVYAFGLALMVLVPAVLWDAQPTGAPQQVLVQFRLDAPQATGVALAGNFSDWQPKYQLTRTAGGVWTVTIPLEPGVHKYSFVVDGDDWQADPLAPSVSDGFGGQNSQIAVLTPDVAAES
jgi:hypothetical protein